MADKVPNIRLEQQRLRTGLAQQHLMRSECLTKIYEAAERIDNERVNLAAHDKAIARFQEQLDGLIQTTGEVTEHDIQQTADAAIKAANTSN